ncbi:MAG: S-layer homology domain-containing protein, partial [Chromatiaceae bacterium]
ATFTGWSGACTGAGACQVNMHGAKSVTATFALKRYTVTATAGSGGTASCTPTAVNYNGSSTCTATPNAGYAFGSWTGACAGQGATCALSSIQTNQTSAASFTVIKEPFNDVPNSHWAYGYINAIRDAGITGGCGNGNYCPQGLVTREQMAAFLVRAVEGEPAADYCGGASYYGDVDPAAWSCRYIKRLSELNITGGCGGGNYCPEGLVTREQTAAFIVRAVEGEPGPDYCGGVAPFLDVAPSNFFCGYIKKLVELGVTQGCGNGNYCPGNEVTREQMAAFLARAFLDMD